MEVTNLNAVVPITAGDASHRRKKPLETARDGGGQHPGSGREHGARGGDTGAGNPASEAFSITGIAGGDLTPQAQRALTALMEEIDALREELERTQGRQGELLRRADTHAFLPVLNRRAFLRELGHVIALVEQLTTPASLLCLTITDGEPIRRRLGLDARDHALAHVCHVLGRVLHATDIIGSLGGCDFAIVLLVADQEAALAKGAAIIEALGAHPFRWLGEDVPITAAIAARRLEHSDDGQTLLAEVDSDLIAGDAAHG